MGTRSGGELLVDTLLLNGVELVSAVPGESFLPVLDALYDRCAQGASIRLATACHEAAAGFMAEAVGKLTGRPGVCVVTRGPGALQASIAVHTAYQDASPMLLVVGQVPRRSRHREAFQELDVPAVFAPMAKHTEEISDAHEIPRIVARALHLSTVGRPGPVVISVPEDVLYDSVEREPFVIPKRTVPGPSEDSVGMIASALAGADAPLIIAGGPGWTQRTADLVGDFAESEGIPVCAAFRRQDAVDNRSDNYVGYLGLGCSSALRAYLREADVIVAIGCQPDEATLGGYDWLSQSTKARRVMVVSEDPADASRSIAAEHVVSAVEPIAAALAERGSRTTSRRGALVKELRAAALDFTARRRRVAGLDLGAAVEYVRRTVGDDAIIANGAGNYTLWVQRCFEFRRFGTQLAPRNGAMGYSLPAAIAAALLFRSRTVVAFAGDGEFLMCGNEISTAMRNAAKIIVIVVSNGMLGTIRMHQERRFPGRVIGTNLGFSDFANHAMSFAVPGEVVGANGDFESAFSRALAHDGPYLIEARVDPNGITPDAALA